MLKQLGGNIVVVLHRLPWTPNTIGGLVLDRFIRNRAITKVVFLRDKYRPSTIAKRKTLIRRKRRLIFDSAASYLKELVSSSMLHQLSRASEREIAIRVGDIFIRARHHRYLKGGERIVGQGRSIRKDVMVRLTANVSSITLIKAAYHAIPLVAIAATTAITIAVRARGELTRTTILRRSSSACTDDTLHGNYLGHIRLRKTSGLSVLRLGIRTFVRKLPIFRNVRLRHN